MASTIESRLRRFARQVRLRSALAGAFEGVAVAALAVLAGVVVARILGFAAPFGWWVAAPLAVGLLVGSVRRVVVAPFGLALGAQHLDRRLGLGGLLLTARETDAEAWRPRLDAALARAAAAAPRLEAAHLLRHALVALLAVGLVALLPKPEPASAAADPLGAAALEELEARLAALEEQAAIEESKAEAIRERIEELEEGLEKDGYLAWTDLDALDARLEHERDQRAGELAKAAEGLAAFAKTAGSEGGDDAEASTRAEMESLLARADEAGLLDDLPPELKQRLGLDAAGGSLDASDLPSDLETLRQLAAALAATAGRKLEGMQAAGELSGLDLAELDAKLREAVGELRRCKLCEGGDEDCPG